MKKHLLSVLEALRVASTSSLLFCLILCGLLSEVAIASETETAELAARSISLVNEVSSRRKTNTLFENWQDATHGVQVNYVNTTQGNLTFLERDLVIVGRFPIVLGRVYDSRLRNGPDFGRGWKLTVEETATIENRTVHFVDASNSTVMLRRSGRNLRGSGVHASIRGVLRRDGLMEITDGRLRRTLLEIEGVYRLVEIADSFGNHLRIEYSGSRIVRVSNGAGATATIQRRDDGRIIGITDGLSRRAQYRYSDDGILRSVNLGAGLDRHTYEYDLEGRLASISDASSRSVARLRYFDDGRVQRSEILGRRVSFAYGDRLTDLVLQNGQSARVTFNSVGKSVGARDFGGNSTTLLSSPGSVRTSLVYDEVPVLEIIAAASGTAKRIRSLVSDEQAVYSPGGLLERLKMTGSRVAIMQYLPNGLVQRISQRGKEKTFEWNDKGDLLSLTDSDRTIHYGVSSSGLVESATSWDGQRIGIGYDNQARVTDILWRQSELPPGMQASYSYGPNGLRTETIFSVGSNVGFSYDSSGNLEEIAFHEDGNVVREDSYEIGAKNQVLAISSTTSPSMRFSYDEIDRIAQISTGGRSLDVEYDDAMRVSRLSLDGNVTYNAAERPYERDRIVQSDVNTHRAILDYRIGMSVFGSIHELVYNRPIAAVAAPIFFDADSVRFAAANFSVLSPDYVVNQGLRRRGLIPNDSGDFMGPWQLDKPSNALFVPPEYLSVNCYICLGYVAIHSLKVNGSSSPGPVDVGESATVESTAGIESCYDPTATQPYQWAYADLATTFGDGTHDYYSQITYPSLSWLSRSSNKTYSTAGSKTISSTVNCSCNVFTYSLQQLVLQVSAPALTGVTISTSPATYKIDRQLNMPNITFTATHSPSTVPLSDVTFHWYAVLDFNQNTQSFSNRFPTSGTIDVNGSNTWSPSWGSFLRGADDLTVFVYASTNQGSTSTVQKDGFAIHGENPTQAQLFAIATSLEQRAVMWQESTHRQFNAARYTGVGLPVWGSPDGWGLMQRDPLQNQDQLWNWETSLNIGVAYLATVRSDAQNYMNFHYNTAANTSDPSDDWSWNPSSQFPERIWDEAFSRYNSGSGIHQPNGNQGVVNCSANTAGCLYRQSVRDHITAIPW